MQGLITIIRQYTAFKDENNLGWHYFHLLLKIETWQARYLSLQKSVFDWESVMQKPKQSQPPIKTKENKTRNKWELKEINRLTAQDAGKRECPSCDKFVLILIGGEIGASLLEQ